MDPVTSYGAAAAIGGAADIAGTVVGSASSRKESSRNRKEAIRQFNIMDDYNKNMTQYRVKDAIKAGVNPLAALGSSANYSPTISSGGTSGAGDNIARGFSSVGDRVQRAVNDYYRDAQVESTELDLESKRLQNDLLKTKIETAVQPGFVDSDSAISIAEVAANPDTFDLSSVGKKSPYPSLLKKWRLPGGKIVQLIDPDAIADTDFTNIEGDRAIGLAYPYLRDFNGTRFRDRVREIWRRRRNGSFWNVNS